MMRTGIGTLPVALASRALVDAFVAFLLDASVSGAEFAGRLGRGRATFDMTMTRVGIASFRVAFTV